MDKVNTYRECIEKIIQEHSSYKSISTNVRALTIFDGGIMDEEYMVVSCIWILKMVKFGFNKMVRKLEWLMN